MLRFRGKWHLALLWSVVVFSLCISLEDTARVDPSVEFTRARRLFLRGHLEESQRAADLGYLRFQKKDPQWAAAFQLLEAEILLRRGFTKDSLRVLRVPHAPYRDSDDGIRELVTESISLQRQQESHLANQKLAQAENLCTANSDLVCGEVARAQGVFAVSEGKLPEARRAFLRALAIARTHHDKYLEATAALNLGWMALQIEHYDDAIDWSTLAYRDSVEIGAEDLSETISGNLGWAYFGLGDSERALGLFTEAEQRAANLGNIRNQVKWLTTSANVYRDDGDFARATVYFKRALALAMKINSDEDTVNALEDLAHSSIDAGRLDDATSYLQQLEPLVQASGNRLDVLDLQFAQARIAAARHQNQQAEVLFRDVEHDPASQTSMRLGAEHELARLFEAEGNPADADRMYRTSLDTFEAARAELRNEDSKLPFLANATTIYDDYIWFLIQRGRNREALALADQSRARTLAQGLGVLSSFTTRGSSAFAPESVARKQNATLLFYWMGKAHSYLWIISEQTVQLVPLPAENEVFSLIARYRKALLGLGDPIEDGNPDGAALYRILVAPSAQFIKPGSNVIILDDGPLSQLNFETLIVPSNPAHYFIEDASLVSAPSLYLLASSKPAQSLQRKLLLVGDAVSPGPDYPALPMASTEMHELAQRFRPQDEVVLAHERATPEAYFANAPQNFSYIHFVAHGVASSTDPLDSAVLLSRSSAAEDSFKLHARDIMQHAIHARLVTISACYGGGTKSYAGEGAVGLAWAFLRAGAHNVIGALWEVSDTSTPRLMGDLYGNLQSGLAPSSALHRAKLDLLHSKGEFRKPFYWAALQIYAGM